MSFKVTCVCNTHELSLTELLDIWRTAISHTCTETSYELINNLVECTLVRYLSHDSLWNAQKGDIVNVTGRTRNNRYTGADGLEKIFTEVLASKLKLVTENHVENQ